MGVTMSWRTAQGDYCDEDMKSKIGTRNEILESDVMTSKRRGYEMKEELDVEFGKKSDDLM
eukprot:4370611-Heterocapsa_arctica.AAC.1